MASFFCRLIGRYTMVYGCIGISRIRYYYIYYTQLTGSKGNQGGILKQESELRMKELSMLW